MRPAPALIGAVNRLVAWASVNGVGVRVVESGELTGLPPG